MPPVEPEPASVSVVVSDKNQLVLASTAIAIPSVEHIGEHVVEWGSLSRKPTKIISRRTFGCQTSPSLETLTLD